MSAQLVPINAGSAPAVLISRPVILIGRHPECDVRIDSPQVSRRHCCLAMAYDRLVIRDLGSSNGIRVNGQSVEEASLEPGDEVAIAHLLYRLVGAVPVVGPKSKATAPAKAYQPPAKVAAPIVDLNDDFIPLDD